MDNRTCDRHQSARAQARITLLNGEVLYACGYCAEAWDCDSDFTIEYETVTV